MTGAQRSAAPAQAFRIEPLRWWHIPTVHRLEAELFPADSPWSPEMFWSELAQGHCYLTCWVTPSGPHGGPPGVEGEGELVGYAGLAVHGEFAEVQTLGVRADRQRGGIGRRLLDGLLARAGDRPVNLEVRTDNTAAIRLYETVGFEVLGVRRRYYQPSGADAFTMTRHRAAIGQRTGTRNVGTS